MRIYRKRICISQGRTERKREQGRWEESEEDYYQKKKKRKKEKEKRQSRADTVKEVIYIYNIYIDKGGKGRGKVDSGGRILFSCLTSISRDVITVGVQGQHTIIEDMMIMVMRVQGSGERRHTQETFPPGGHPGY